MAPSGVATASGCDMTYVPLIGVAGSARQVIITATAAAAIIAAVPAATAVIRTNVASIITHQQ